MGKLLLLTFDAMILGSTCLTRASGKPRYIACTPPHRWDFIGVPSSCSSILPQCAQSACWGTADGVAMCADAV
eukprot:6217797-Amphidinium_carterae.1